MVAALLLLAAQQWNTPDALDLAHRAIERRRSDEAASGPYTSRARGTVLFLAQVGSAAGPPRLVKADELQVEVYWEGVNRSKQTIIAWREHRYLPTDIRYHRDHLGIVTDDFGDAVRLGEGDEVRDVIHPLAPGGPGSYDYALGDSVTVSAGASRIAVRELLVRPRDPARPLVAGTLYVDLRTADLVRFRFGFTAAAYRQADLEGITVVLERALVEGRWLPWRQEIEIHRQTAWLEFPFQTTIRARWEIGDYDLAPRGGRATLSGLTWGGLSRAGPDSGWGESLDSAVTRAGGVMPRADMAAVRDQLRGMLASRARSTLPPTRLALGSLSDLARVNRVQGLAVGIAGSVRLGVPELRLRPRVGVGLADGRLTGGGEVSFTPGRLTLTVAADRSVRDLSDWPSVSGLVASIAAQEGGTDYGDWVLLDRLSVGARWAGAGAAVRLELSNETTRDLASVATPSRGTFADNPPLGAGSVLTARAGLELGSTRALGSGLVLRTDLEAGAWDRGYLRGTVEARGRFPAGQGALDVLLRGGGTVGTAPDWRTFVLGGRGSLVGEPYRAFGGRHLGLVRVEWRVPVRIPSLRLGDYLDVGGETTLAPFAALGWSGEPPAALHWRPTDGLRPTLGVASELLFNALRLEIGWSPRARRFGVVLDAAPAWWPVL